MPNSLLAVPYAWQQGDPNRHTVILDNLTQHPSWVAVPMEEAERRVLFASILVDPKNLLWEVWRGGELVGMLYLGEITPAVSATLHFVFFDKNLVGKTRLLRLFLRERFTEYRKITMYIPEFVDPLLGYIRSKFGFRFEGESRSHILYQKLGIQNPQKWVAEHGSRREACHWHEGKWWDVLVLRLMADEYAAFEAEHPM